MADVEYEGEAPPNGAYYYPPPPAEEYPPAESECFKKSVVRDHVRTYNTYSVLYNTNTQVKCPLPSIHKSSARYLQYISQVPATCCIIHIRTQRHKYAL